MDVILSLVVVHLCVSHIVDSFLCSHSFHKNFPISLILLYDFLLTFLFVSHHPSLLPSQHYQIFHSPLLCKPKMLNSLLLYSLLIQLHISCLLALPASLLLLHPFVFPSNTPFNFHLELL